MFSANLFLPPALHKLYSEYYRVLFFVQKGWQERLAVEEGGGGEELEEAEDILPPSQLRLHLDNVSHSLRNAWQHAIKVKLPRWIFAISLAAQLNIVSPPPTLVGDH